MVETRRLQGSPSLPPRQHFTALCEFHWPEAALRSPRGKSPGSNFYFQNPALTVDPDTGPEELLLSGPKRQ